jgi:putative SOS response-associated peptidase YedK
MCGRFVLDRYAGELVSLFDVDVTGDLLPEPSWNIAPTERIAIVLDSLPRATPDDEYPEPVRRLESARWGLVPGFAKSPTDGPPLFNARSEDVADKPAFKAAVEKRRAVIPAAGYYEWRVIDGAKQPVYVSLPGDELVLFAGLFDWWRNPAAADGTPERWLLSATMLTQASTGELASIHPRMPVFLDADVVEGWLDPAEDGSQELVDEIVAASAEVAERMQFHEVGAAVGSVQNKGPELNAPVG